MRVLCCLALFLLVSCGASNLPNRAEQSPIVQSKSSLKNSKKLVLFVPGALNSIGLFRPALDWKDAGYRLAFYRFPGYDGLSAAHRLDIEDAGLEIAEYVNRQAAQTVRLVGYSTGGPVVLEAAKHIQSKDLKVAAMSSAVPFPISVSTALRGIDNFGKVIAKLGTFERDRIWKQYYQVLLFGEAGLEKPELQDQIKTTTERELKNVKVPDNSLIAQHTNDLRFWRLRDAGQLEGVDIRFFHGLEDPVFSTRQTVKFSALIPNAAIQGYPGQGHLLFLTAPRVFDDILNWFEEP